MLEAIVGVIGFAILGIVGWAFQLTSRVAVVEANHEGLKELLIAQYVDLKARLDRIENNLRRE